MAGRELKEACLNWVRAPASRPTILQSRFDRREQHFSSKGRETLSCKRDRRGSDRNRGAQRRPFLARQVPKGRLPVDLIPDVLIFALMEADQSAPRKLSELPACHRSRVSCQRTVSEHRCE